MKYKNAGNIPFNELIVCFEDMQTHISPEFLDRTNAAKNLHKLKDAYFMKYMIYKMIKQTRSIKKMKVLAEDLNIIELYIQELFNFKPSKAHIRFWETPKCTCPKLDNIDRWPTGLYVTAQDCPLHSI